MTRFLHARVLPALSRSGLGVSGEVATRLVRFARRSALFRHDSAGRSYAVKLWGPSTPPSHTVEAAFAWLQKLRHHDPAQTRLPTTRPVIVLPEVATVVMDWVDAPNLRETIVRGDRVRGLQGVVAAFRWLDRLHRLDPPVEGYLNWHLSVTIPEQLLRQHDALIPDADRPRVERVFARLVPLGEELRRVPCEFRVLHLDATCANFLFDGTQAIGIDLHERRYDDPVLDYCKLLVDADALLNAGTAVEPPFALGRDLQTLLLGAPLLRDAPRIADRIRLHLMSVGLTNYGRRLLTGKARVMQERERHLAVAEALASDSFVAVAADTGRPQPA